ncbi:MAG: PIN domain-containing protein [Chloroflexota bacterium]|nr:PIN domain-containing protein [Chloroflexota bacterium]
MRLLFDTNIVLDVLLDRRPFVEHSKQLWEAVDEGRLAGYVTATTLTNIFYIARKLVGVDKASAAVKVCLDTFEICSVDRSALELALNMAANDYEDALQVACAQLAGLDGIVTRDTTYPGSSVAIYTPDIAVQAIGK